LYLLVCRTINRFCLLIRQTLSSGVFLPHSKLSSCSLKTTLLTIVTSQKYRSEQGQFAPFWLQSIVNLARFIFIRERLDIFEPIKTNKSTINFVQIMENRQLCLYSLFVVRVKRAHFVTPEVQPLAGSKSKRYVII
jgi:hypothetical protein